MRVAEILAQYPDATLDRLASDKVDEVANLRLPREVLIQEIAAALASLSYVGEALAPAQPPTYAFLKLLLDSEGHTEEVQGFRDRVLDTTMWLTEMADGGKGLPSNKNYPLYLQILYAAWEDDGHVDRSEALLLGALRKELGLGIREHLLLEHHSLVRPLWDTPKAYTDCRKLLLGTGLVLIHEDRYVLADEVAQQIRRCWEIDLEDSAYGRLLQQLNGAQLREALEASALPLSGSKEERVQRLIEALVPPSEVLDVLHIDEVKDLCRRCDLPVSQAKADLIGSLIEHFDSGRDLLPPEEAEAEREPPAPEPRELPPEQLTVLLERLKLDQLYDILARRGLRRSGSKSERVERLVDSPWSEATLLGELRHRELVELCRRLGVQVSGVKSELIERLISWAAGQELGTVFSDDESAEKSVTDVRKDAGFASPAVEAPAEVVEAPADVVEAAADAMEVADSTPRQGAEEAPAKPDGFDEIRRRFPELTSAEQVILALLRSARSLNEREIERAASRHGLGWFLTKAHMADLLARLRLAGASPVAVRSTGRHNIYEWIGRQGEGGVHELDRQAARDVVDALRHGVVPERHLDLLMIGQDTARRHLVELLEHVQGGRSEFKFVRGPYGAGKTFLCSWLRERALDADMAVATVRIGPDQPLSDLPVFFAGLADGLRTYEKRGASALADILESWLLTLHRRTAQVEGIDAWTQQGRARLMPLVEQRIEEDLARFAGIDPGFGPAVRAFYRSRVEGDRDTAAAALAWLRGSRALASGTLRALGVRGQLEPDGVFPRMRAILEVIAEGRLKGLLLLVDELELVRRFPHARQRERAYETLRLLIDECGENRLPGCLLVCTGTDQLFDDQRYGLGSYQALANRVAPPREGDGLVSVRQPILQLEPLDGERLLEVALRVRDIHAQAYGWDAAGRIEKSVLERMVDEETSFGDERIGRIPRPFLRKVVNLLDLCEERPGINAEELLQPPAHPSPSTDDFLDRWED
jgi:hypothetical protein